MIFHAYLKLWNRLTIYNMSGKNKEGLQTIRYQKNINGEIYYFEEVRTGKKHVAPDTMYKRKGGAVDETPDVTQEP